MVDSAAASPATAPVPPLLARHPGWWALRAVAALPFGVLYALADAVAFLLYRVIGYRRRVVRGNLAKAFPEKSDAERRQIEAAFYRNLADLLVETVKLAAITPAQLAARVNLGTAAAPLHDMMQGRTTLVLGSHLCNWEWLMPAANVTVTGARVDAVYRPVKSPFGEALVTHLRTRFGGHLVRMQDVGRDMVRNRAVPRALCLIADQTPPGGEIQFFTTFLHQDTPFFVGADKLAASFRLPVYFMSMRRVRRGRYELSARLLYDGTAPLPVPPKHVTDDPADHPITEAFARALEEDIRAAPADYLWSHKRWKNARW